MHDKSSVSHDVINHLIGMIVALQLLGCFCAFAWLLLCICSFVGGQQVLMQDSSDCVNEAKKKEFRLVKQQAASSKQQAASGKQQAASKQAGKQASRQADNEATRPPGHQAQPNKAPPPGLLRAGGVTRSAKNFIPWGACGPSGERS